MPESNISIKTGKDIVTKELTALRRSVNLACHSTCAEIELSIDAYPFTAQARNATGELIGYISAFSDGVFITMVGDLLVHTDYQHRGIGAALLKRVELRYPGIPIQAHSLSACLSFFTSQGYMPPAQPIRIVLKNTTRTNETVIAWARN